jgi:hypothetical protein
VQSKTDFTAILRTLAEHRVPFIVVGGIAAVLQGAPIATFDLDVVHSRDSTSISNLLAGLDQLGASYRTAGERNLKPDESHLASRGHQLLITRFGPLDLLGSIGKDRDYNSLFDESVTMEIAPGLTVRVLTLSAVIKTKEETGHEKDTAGLAILRRTLEEKNRQ